jgi:hypothetical protein
MYLNVDVANLVNYFTKNNKNLIKIENFVNFLLRYCLFCRPDPLFVATQVISLKSVCRGHKCAIMPVFMFAIQVFLSKMVCRCAVSVLLPLSVLAIQGSRPEMVYRCIASALFSFSVLAIQGFSPEKVCRCTNHILRP